MFTCLIKVQLMGTKIFHDSFVDAVAILRQICTSVVFTFGPGAPIGPRPPGTPRSP